MAGKEIADSSVEEDKRQPKALKKSDKEETNRSQKEAKSIAEGRVRDSR